jgi:serine/threonine protein kinase/tetratricopeptide (TPR) repeat protein
MTPVAHEIDSILAAAVEMDCAARRREFVDRACAGDERLKRRVEQLLENHFRAGSFLEAPAAGLSAVPAERPGAVVGPYRLLEQIGEGGMGLVFAAEQERPVRRQVALKVIKPGMDSSQVLARFEAERQALALMDHPNIAKVLDAGTTEAHGLPPVGSGRPYFVMELVKGVPLTRYCDEHQLTPRQRLELFVPVCQAVQHAHQKGIIHRDLKPSNVLVAPYDGRPVPKVIDFGVAKAIGPKLTEQTLTTDVGTVVGTLEYMSPEQAEPGGLDIDTRSDVYSLGVLLYELLTGTTPLENEPGKKAALLDVLRRIREEEPRRPSNRLSTTADLPRIAARRGLPPRELSRLVKGELDWIVMKCLEKDRGRRYETANGLARDLERYLADEPVEACPPSTAYRLRKFVRKNRTLLTTVTGFLAVVFVGGAVTVKQAVLLARAEREEARRAEAQARERARRIQEVHHALNRARELREQARSAAGEGDQWAEALACVHRAGTLLQDGPAEPELAREVQDLRDDLAREAADRRMASRLEDVRLLQADVHVPENRFLLERAIPEYRRVFQEYGLPAEETDPAAAAEFLRRRPAPVRGVLVAALDDWLDLARTHGRSEAGWLERVLSAADSDAWRQRLRDVRARRDRAGLEQLAREVDVATQPPQALFVLDRALYACGAGEDSIALLRRTQEAYPGDFWTNQNLGTALADRQPPQLDEAIRFLTVAVALRPDSPGVRFNLSLALGKNGRLGEALAACRKAVALKPEYDTAYTWLGFLLWKAGRLGEALAAYRRAVALRPDSADAHADLAAVLLQTRRPDEALAAYRRALTRNPDLWAASFKFGNALKVAGRLEEAAAAYRQAVRVKPDLADAHCNLGVTLTELGRLGEAVAALREALRLKPADAASHYNLGNVFLCQGRRDQAAAAFRRAIELKPDYAEAHCNLGWVLRREADFAGALAAFRRGHELASRHPNWPYPSDQWVRECRQLAELEPRLPALLRGELRPASAEECNAFALLCSCKNLHAACARLRAEAFAADPKLAENLEAGYRYDAACAAALAAKEADGQERVRWRKQAVIWLQADLAAKAALLKTGTAKDGRRVLEQLRRWRYDLDLAGLREAAAVTRLPDEEQEACNQLWAEVDALLNQAAAGPAKPHDS